jgi:hypothetical protein
VACQVNCWHYFQAFSHCKGGRCTWVSRWWCRLAGQLSTQRAGWCALLWPCQHFCVAVQSSYPASISKQELKVFYRNPHARTHAPDWRPFPTCCSGSPSLSGSPPPRSQPAAWRSCRHASAEQSSAPRMLSIPSHAMSHIACSVCRSVPALTSCPCLFGWLVGRLAGWLVGCMSVCCLSVCLSFCLFLFAQLIILISCV